VTTPLALALVHSSQRQDHRPPPNDALQLRTLTTPHDATNNARMKQRRGEQGTGVQVCRVQGATSTTRKGRKKLLSAIHPLTTTTPFPTPTAFTDATTSTPNQDPLSQTSQRTWALHRCTGREAHSGGWMMEERHDPDEDSQKPTGMTHRGRYTRNDTRSQRTLKEDDPRDSPTPRRLI